MGVSTELIQKLREQTGAGIMDAKRALETAGGDVEKAIAELRKHGQKVAAKKQERQTSEGLVEAYIHGGGRVASMIKLTCETDFVARTDQFKELAHQLAMHIAAFNPSYISADQMPADILEQERTLQRELLAKEGNKKPEMIEKIIEGKVQKRFAEVCLLDQAFVMDDSKTVRQVITEKIAELGENIVVADFKRLAL